MDRLDSGYTAARSALTPSALRERFRGCLLAAACGDALGAAFEGHAVVSTDRLDAAETATSPLCYTDDTAMTCVVAEHLIGRLGEGADLEEDKLVHAFAAAWRLEPWRGYGVGPPHVFRLVTRGVPWHDAATGLFGGRGSYGNGGAMRVAPVALAAPDLSTVTDWARRSANVTHAHPLAGAGAVLQAVAVALALATDPHQPLNPHEYLDSLHTLNTHPAYTEQLHRVRLLLNHPSPQLAARQLGNGVSALESVPLAILAFLHHPNEPARAVRYAITAGGDTDTIAAMTAAIAGVRTGHTALPGAWLTRLEQARRITRLADHLAHLVHPRHPSARRSTRTEPDTPRETSE